LELPLTFTAGFARNLADDVKYDTAWALGAFVGTLPMQAAGKLVRCISRPTRTHCSARSRIPDFGDGRTDAAGWVFKGVMRRLKNISPHASYFVNTTNKDVGTELDVTRLQLDVNYKF